MFSSRALIAVALVLSGTACRCDSPPTTTKVGELNFIFEKGGVSITSPEGDYDFGKVAMGVKKTLKVTVQNRGDGSLDVTSMERVEGGTVQIGETAEPMPVFKIAFAPQRVAPGSSIELEAVFDAPLETDPSIRTKEHEVRLRLHVINADVEAGELVLHGTAVSGACSVPDTLDFGAVAIGDTFKRSFTIENLSPLPAVANAGAITSNSGDDRSFMFAAESAKGDFPIEMGLKRDVVISFSPTDAKDYLALVKVRAAEQCPEVSVRLLGIGVEQVLNCAPNPYDFGYVTPGLQRQGELTLSNSSLLPISLTGMVGKVGSTVSQEFKVVGADAITVPAATRETQRDGTKALRAGTVSVQLAFKPGLLGPRAGTLTGATGLEKQPQLSCPLKGAGGGPDIELKPGTGTLNVGRVPYFQSAAKPFYVSKKITVQNVGTLPNPPDARANLHLGAGSQQNGWPRPYWRVVPKNAQSLASEICVGEWDEVNYPTAPCRDNLALNGPGRYDPGVGIVAATGVSLLDIPIRVTPAGPNKQLEWDVVILSNDADEPEVTITVKAQSVVMPPCNYQLTPTALNFGLVTPPQYRSLSFAIKNLGTAASDVCLITTLDLKVGSDPLYSLPSGVIDQYEMAPSETVTISVRATPTGSVGTNVVQATGAVLFGISSPTTPEREVALTTSVATSCLTIAPSDLDFGTVQKDCNSARRTFSVYNTCMTPVTVNSWGMIAGAGIPAGSSVSCPGPTDCPEFHLDGSPSFVMGTQLQPGVAMPATFALKYRPLDFGSDTGAFLLKVTQNGQVVDYIVTLRGQGDAVGRNIDTFQQDPRPKADILLVIDNSCSMADKQTALAQNFASFIGYATRANVDYQLGIITTDLGSNVIGELITETNTVTGMLNPKILKPSTLNVAALFTARVKVGIAGGNEGMAEPAVRALTAPVISQQNAGFLRADAVLAVVVVSDAGDQSPLAATVYENQLRNIKGVQHASQFSFNQIGPFAGAPTTGCAYDDFIDISKNVYLIQRLNGVRDEICTPNWAQTLEGIGKTAFGYRTNFFLTADPDLNNGNEITVRIDGMNVLPYDPRGAPVWAYDPMTNSISFQPLFVPEPGKTLTVEYFVVCQ